ncbi:hypothetical protein CYLTODRAFT_487809 [Cylindrobasidium torrendii FP15055 ss-10]|uniref:F-box domain-containing protein n=1 Tax=Cylindrobasidium torrendii FP15055 ss-10 TaxID=1314674 RepID=A0A0D7BKY9_9AGAR|nr:hypothetical protein CYLTODRAFT_487809 [Cylindrobasidium torrendii FP15055 ss-10]
MSVSVIIARLFHFQSGHSRVPTLPQELLDLIIDHLASTTDKKTLMACALTNKAFLDRARTHLFGDVVLTPQSAAKFTTASHPPFSHVRHLRLIGLGQTALKWEQLDFSATHIRQLSLINVDAGLLLQMKWTPTIESLYLNFIRVESLDKFYQLMRNFPQLRHLTLYQFYCCGEGEHTEASEHQHQVRIPLRTLELSFRYSRSDVVDMLTSPRSPFVLDDLEELTIKPNAMDTDGLLRISDALQVGGDSLATLNVGPFRMHGLADDIPIPRLTSFRVLRVSVSDRAIHQNLIDWWTTLFSTSSTSWDLQHLTVNAAVHLLDWDSLSGGGRFHCFAEKEKWERLASALVGKQMSALRTVTIRLELKEGPLQYLKDIKAVIERALERTSANFKTVVDLCP